MYRVTTTAARYSVERTEDRLPRWIDGPTTDRDLPAVQGAQVPAGEPEE